MHVPATNADPRQILQTCRTIAVLGAHWSADRPACYVPEYLFQQGYQVFAVNPMGVGRVLWGQPVGATLAEIKEPIDMVDVFRRPTDLAAHLDDIAAMQPLPQVVWLQLGIRNDSFAESLRALGITVVQDRCTLADHRRLGLPPRPSGHGS